MASTRLPIRLAPPTRRSLPPDRCSPMRCLPRPPEPPLAQPNRKTPYSSQGNISVEQQLTKDIVLSASGIFSRGIHLMGSVDLNAPNPTTSYTYTIADASGSPTGSFTTPIYLTPRPNTKYGAVIEDTNGVDSVY